MGERIVGGRFKLGELVSYQGDPDCTDPRHGHRYAGGEMIPGCITGYHCPRCGKDCAMTGHDCGPSEEGTDDE